MTVQLMYSQQAPMDLLMQMLLLFEYSNDLNSMTLILAKLVELMIPIVMALISMIMMTSMKPAMVLR